MVDEIILGMEYDEFLDHEVLARKELTVEDVIRFLEKYPKDWKVGIHIDDGEYNRICSVDQIMTREDSWFKYEKERVPEDMVILKDGKCYKSDY